MTQGAADEPARRHVPVPPELAGRVLDSLGQAVIVTDADGTVTYWNARAEELYGWAADEALGRSIADLTVTPAAQDVAQEIMAALREGTAWSGAFGVQRRDGTTFTALVTDTGLYDVDGRLEGVVGISVNLGDVLRPYLTHSSEAALVTSADGVVYYASPAVEVAFGWQESDLVGRSLRDLVHAQDQPVLLESLAEAVAAPAGTPPPVRELRVLTGSGAFAWTEVRWSDLMHDPGVRGLVCTLRDVDERHQTLDRLTDLALRDTLTGLPNRAVLVERIGHAIARRDGRGALLFVDLDDFKAVNDDLGHLTGDLLLQVVAHRLITAVRPEDTCGRLAGDEFVVLAESVKTRDAAVHLAERLEAAVATVADVRGVRLTPRVSIGVTMLADAGTVDQALQAADRDMYRSKARHHADPRPIVVVEPDPVVNGPPADR